MAPAHSRTWRSVAIAVLTGFAAVATCHAPSFAECGSECDGKAPHVWLTEAESLITRLSALTLLPPDSLKELLQPDNSTRKAHIVLWELWLTTGMPPLPYHGGFQTYLRDNVVAYREYVVKHRDLDSEQIARLGIANVSSAMGSPLWYMATKYLAHRASVESEWHFEMRTSPSYFLLEVPQTKQGYVCQSAAFESWLKENKDEMAWDPVAKRLYPRHGKYVGTDALFETLGEFSDREGTTRIPLGTKR